MIRSVQTIGTPVELTFTEAEFDQHFAHVAHMEAGGTDAGHREWLEQVLASRGLAPLPADFCWSLCKLDFTLQEVAAPVSH